MLTIWPDVIVDPLTFVNNSKTEDTPAPKRGFDFWMVYVSGLLVDVLSALDLVSITHSGVYGETHMLFVVGNLDDTPYNRRRSAWHRLHMGR